MRLAWFDWHTLARRWGTAWLVVVRSGQARGWAGWAATGDPGVLILGHVKGGLRCLQTYPTNFPYSSLMPCMEDWIPPEVWKPDPWWIWLLPQRFSYWRAERKHRWGHLLNDQGGYCCVCGARR
jgi:hypothetical protein